MNITLYTNPGPQNNVRGSKETVITETKKKDNFSDILTFFAKRIWSQYFSKAASRDD